MATKVWLREGSRYLGAATIFDANPSFYLLMLAFNDANAITWRSRDDRFELDLGDAAAPLFAD